MSPYGASFACGAPPMTAPGYVPSPGRSLNSGALPLMTPWPTTFEAVSVPWPPMPGSKSPVHGEHLAGAEDQVHARRRPGRPADRGHAVGDEVQQAAGQIRVAVAVHVAVRRRRRLGDRLLVAETKSWSRST